MSGKLKLYTKYMGSRTRVVKIDQNVWQLAHYFHTPGDHTVVLNRENFPNYSYYKNITRKWQQKLVSQKPSNSLL